MAINQPLNGTANHYNETLHLDGSPLPEWQSLLAHIEDLSSEQRSRRQHDINRQLRANGLAYQPEGDENQQRNRSLDLLPVLFNAESWRKLCSGLNQRARLKQALYRDIYGEQSLLKDNIIPAAMLYAHNGYVRDLVNPESQPSDTAALAMYSCDVGRNSLGDWQVLDDLCQYPAGIGYALENRIVMSRVLPRSYKQYRVNRIASYFRQLQHHVLSGSGISGRCVLLSYPSSHPHYFEFAWLARYLGYPLVEPADLTVRDNVVYLKTISGLQPIDVILRLIDDCEIDPLMTGSRAAAGVPGLLETARLNGVRILNPIGTGVLDNPAYNSIMPQLCQSLLNEPLQLHSPTTYWLGDADQRTTALTQFDNLLFRHVDNLDQLHEPQLMTETDKNRLLNNIALTPNAYVAQQHAELSISPRLVNDQLVNHPFALRIFQIESGDTFETMPGGLCLLNSASEATRRSLQDLSGTKDVWVLSNEPVNVDTLLKSHHEDAAYAIANGELPSRLAESQFWLGRHSERVESTVRLLRIILQSLLSEERSPADNLATPAMQGLLRSVTAATGTFPGFAGRGGKKRLSHPERELISLLQDEKRQGTLANSLQQWQFSAAGVTDRLSSEQLRVLNRLSELQSGLANLELPRNLCDEPIALGQTIDLLDELLLVMSANTGLEHENITHSDGWLFTMLGRRIERAHQISVTISAVMSTSRDNTRVLEYLLRLFDSVMTYRGRYRSGLDNRLVLQLLLLDEINPRSLAFQFKCIEAHVSELPGRRSLSNVDPLNRLAVAGLSRVRLAQPEQLLSEERDARQSLQKFLRVLQDLSASMTNAITSQYFTHTEPQRQLGQISTTVTTHTDTDINPETRR